MATNQEIGSLIDKITTSGRKDIDQESLKQLKKFCKDGGDAVVEQIFHMLTFQISKNHSQIRYAALLLMDELFMRSHRFRSLLLKSEYLQVFLDLTLGLNDDKPLPPPKAWAADLKKKAIECIDIWYHKFKNGYPSLDTLYKHFSRTNVDFQGRELIREGERRERETEEERLRESMRRKMEKVSQDFQLIKEECDSQLVQICNCFELLYPGIQKEDIFCEEDLFAGSRDQLSLTKTDVPITLKPYIEITQDKDNETVIQNLKDIYQSIVSHCLPKIKSILKEMTKAPDLCKDQVKQAIDLKSHLMLALQKFFELKIIEKTEQPTEDRIENDDESEDDDEFEEVQEKEGLEMIIPQHRRKEYGLGDDELSDSNKPSSSSSYSGPICRVPLPNGKLCPRRDAKKCPFHGVIIPRDVMGIPVNEEDRKKAENPKEPDVPDWQDPVFLRDLEAQIGIDLTVKKRGKGKGTKTKQTLLQDIRVCDETPRKRLKKKIFNKNAQERVARDLDSIDANRSRQFEDQWNYALHR